MTHSILRLVAGLSLFAISAVAQSLVPTTVAVNSSPNPSILGEGITLTASVGGRTSSNARDARVSILDAPADLNPRCAGVCLITGTVTFYDGATLLGTEPLSSFGPTASTTTPFTAQLALGVHFLSASYSGDSTYAASTSPPLVQTVIALQITSTSPLPTGAVGSPYLVTLATNTGTAPYTWTFSAGSLPPPGLNLSPSGVLSGTPKSAGTTSFSVTVSDSLGAVASATFSITVTTSPQSATSFLVKTVAGGYGGTVVGASSSLGDGGPAQQALLDPMSVAVDMLGNVFIADYINNRVRKVSPAGIITTFAGLEFRAMQAMADRRPRLS